MFNNLLLKMPRTKRPARKQEKTTEDDEALKKLNKIGNNSI